MWRVSWVLNKGSGVEFLFSFWRVFGRRLFRSRLRKRGKVWWEVIRKWVSFRRLKIRRIKMSKLKVKRMRMRLR